MRLARFIGISLIGEDDRRRTAVGGDRRTGRAVLERAKTFTVVRFRIDPVDELFFVEESGVVDVAPVGCPARTDRSTSVGSDLLHVPAVGIAGVELGVVGALAVDERQARRGKTLRAVGKRLDHHVGKTAGGHSRGRIPRHRLVGTDRLAAACGGHGSARESGNRDRPGRSNLENSRELEIPLEGLLIPRATLDVERHGYLLGAGLFDLDDRRGDANERKREKALKKRIFDFHSD